MVGVEESARSNNDARRLRQDRREGDVEVVLEPDQTVIAEGLDNDWILPS